MAHPVLMVPGWRNSGPGHWQSLWESQIKGARRVEMPNWEFPHCQAWVESLDEALAAMAQEDPAPPVLVGHSVGCLAIVHWASRHERPVQAAFLVAPADVERKGCPEVLRDFAPIPRQPLPFPGQVIASDDDPHLTESRARGFAESWGLPFVLVPGGGHLNPPSGYGEWPAGEAMLREWLR